MPSPFLLISMMRLLFFLASTFLIVSCEVPFRKTTPRMNSLNEMQQTDVDFSNVSREKGMRNAFKEFMEEEAVLLRPGYAPILGKDAFKWVSSLPDSTFTLTWEPAGGDVAESGDLGYTFGIYEMKSKDTVLKGTYVSIWRKQKDGRWKFVLDSGNEGVEDRIE
jgi:ketosteroid isomerase-like protein